MCEEIWRDIVGYEDIYQISTLGRIKSAHRLCADGKRWIKEKIMKQSTQYQGYKQICLNLNKIKATMYIHRLVAEAFIDNPDNLPQVNHKDEDKTNNLKTNLEWVTSRVNNNYSKNKKATSKYPGVHLRKLENKFTSQCRFNGRIHYLGYSNDELDAAKAYVDFCNENNLKY